MNIIDKVKMFFKIQSSIKEVVKMAEDVKVNEVKPFYKSRRFWMTTITQLINILGTAQGFIPVQVGVIGGIVLQSIYNIMQTLEQKPEITTLVENK